MPNSIIEAPGFYISYNPYDTDTYGCCTTALVIGNMEHFYILNGDHRTPYSERIERGLMACLAYFQDNIHLKNKHSESLTPAQTPLFYFKYST